MREIKFRAWDGKEMVLTPQVPYDWDLNEALSNDQYVFMQHTGFKDKNDERELYEGDIVRVDIEQTIGNAQTEQGVLQWNDDGFWEVDFPQHGQTIGVHAFTEDGFEHIGNIYENPKLLK